MTIQHYTQMNLGADGDKLSMNDLGTKKVQRVQLQVGIDEAVTDINDANPLPVGDFKHLVQQGLVTGTTIMEAFGEIQAAGNPALGEDLWRSGDVTGPELQPLPLDAGVQMSFVSTNVADDAAGTGIKTLSLHYLDDTGAEQLETLTLDGTTVANTTATDIRFVQSLDLRTVGTGGSAAGDISLYKFGGSIGSDLYAMIALGGSTNLGGSMMVPLGKTLYMREAHFGESEAKSCAFRIRSTDISGVLLPRIFVDKSTTRIKNSATQVVPLSIKVPALSIVKVTVYPDATGASCSAGWWGYLVDD